MKKIYIIILGLVIVLILSYIFFIRPTYSVIEKVPSPNNEYELIVYIENQNKVTKYLPFYFSLSSEMYYRKIYVELLNKQGEILTNTSKIQWCCDFQYGDLMIEWDWGNNKVWLTKFDYIDLENYKPSCSCFD